MSKFREFEEKVRGVKKDIEGSHLGLIKLTSPLLQHLRVLNVIKKHHGGPVNETNIEVTQSLIKARISAHLDTLEEMRSIVSKIESPSVNEHPLDSITSKAMLHSLKEVLNAYKDEIVAVQVAIQ